MTDKELLELAAKAAGCTSIYNAVKVAKCTLMEIHTTAKNGTH